MTQQTSTPGSAGYSQQGPNDHSSEFNRVAFLTKQFIAKIESMMPVQVVTVHPGSGSPPAGGTVDVQLLVSQIDGSGNVVQNGIVYGVPFFRLQGGPWAIIIDPAANDFGFIVTADRDITAVKANPGIQAPGSPRKYSYSDGIFVPCPFGGAPPVGTFVFNADGTWVLTDKFENVLQGSSSGIAVTTSAGGDFTVNGISVTKHTHAVTAAPGETGPPVG